LNPLRAFAIAAFVHLVWLGALAASPEGARNLRFPEGPFAGNAWASSDLGSYLEPARAFARGEGFAADGAPDFHRTVGYPAWLWAWEALLGPWAFAGALVGQALVAALGPAAVAGLAAELRPGRVREARLAFGFVVAAGGFAVTSAAWLTDGVFAALLLAALWLAARAARTGRAADWLLHVALLGVAAQVRPVLFAFTPVQLLALWALSRRQPAAARAWRQGLLAAAVTLPLLLAPGLRNLAHHGVFAPSDALQVNLFKQFARRVLESAGEAARWEAAHAELGRRHGFAARAEWQARVAREAIAAHPGAAAVQLATNATGMALGAHWSRGLRLIGAPAGVARAPLALWGPLNAALWALAAVTAARGLRAREPLVLAGVALVAFLALPTVFDPAGPRMRLPVEGPLALAAAIELSRRVPRLAEAA
jgi:hypothetical protein